MDFIQAIWLLRIFNISLVNINFYFLFNDECNHFLYSIHEIIFINHIATQVFQILFYQTVDAQIIFNLLKSYSDNG